MPRPLHLALLAPLAVGLAAGLAACPSLDGFTGGSDASAPVIEAGATDTGGGPGDSGTPQDARPPVDAAPVVLVTVSGSNLGGFSSDGAHVYWSLAQSGYSSIVRCPVTGCANPEAIADAGPYRAPRSPDLAVTGQYVVYDVPASFESDGGLKEPGSMWRLAKDGGAPALVVSGDVNATQVVADETTVYWANYGVQSAIMSCPISGCASPTILSAQPLSDGDHELTGLAIDGTYVYFSLVGGPTVPGAILRCPLAGCGGAAPYQIAPSDSNPYAVAVDGQRVYWANAGDVGTGKPGSVLSSEKKTNAVITLASNQGTPYLLTVDDTNVYWTDTDRSMVLGVPSGGGVVFTLATGLTNPSWIASDSKRVFWMTERDIMAWSK